MKHAHTRRSNANSKAQANMHTFRNNQCSPDMQCSNTWTMETSHDCKSNTKSIKTTTKTTTTGFYWKAKEKADEKSGALASAVKALGRSVS